MNTTINRIIISTLVLISCATKAAELPSSRASKHTGPVLTLKPERKRPLSNESIYRILGAQRADGPFARAKKQQRECLAIIESCDYTLSLLSNSNSAAELRASQKKELLKLRKEHVAAMALCPPEQKEEFAAILRQEFEARKEQFRRERIEARNLLEIRCDGEKKVRQEATESLNALKALEALLDRIDEFRLLNNEFAHKIHTLAKRQRRQ